MYFLISWWSVFMFKSKNYVFAHHIVKNTSQKAFRGSGGGAPRKKMVFVGRTYIEKCIWSIEELLKSVYKIMIKSQKIPYRYWREVLLNFFSKSQNFPYLRGGVIKLFKNFEDLSIVVYSLLYIVVSMVLCLIVLSILSCSIVL